jgi:sugar-specific transcriptional regulator TrmB
MIVKEDFLKKLKGAFDLNIYEAKIWAALLSKGISSAGELADISEVPRSRSYDILESLEKKGFIIMKLGKPIKYIAVDPKEVLERVKKNVQSRTTEKLKVLEKVSDTSVYKSLESLYVNGVDNVDPSNLSGVMKGRNNLTNQIETMFRNAKKSILISTTEKGFSRKMDVLMPLMKNLKNVDIKVIVPNYDKNLVKNTGVKVKTSDISSRFVLVDGKELMFMVTDDDKIHESYDSGIWVKSPYFVGSMESLFNMSWKGL